MPYLLSGMAAADGLLSLARLLNDGNQGRFKCPSCGASYAFMIFGDRIAVYLKGPARTVHLHGDDDKSFADYKEGAPSRADGFLEPIAENDILDARIAALLSIAERAARPDLALRVRHFAGTFRCCRCSVQGPMEAV